jgi:DNA-binding LacI/PurR family transcriptional regulator
LLEPSLTAISYDARAIGREGARLLLDAAREERKRPREVRIDVELVVRRSCGCAYDPARDIAEVLR